jgi:hypothetical protein
VRVHRDLKVFVSVLVLVAIALVWLVHHQPPQKAVGQELTTEGAGQQIQGERLPPAPVTEEVPALESSTELTEDPAVQEPLGISGLGITDITGRLKHFPASTQFRCSGPSPTEGTGSVWICFSPSGRLLSAYEVTIVAQNPLTIRSVEATTRGVSDEKAAGFFGYVSTLTLPATDPANPEAWVDQNISSGGSLFAKSAQLTLYGTKDERTLQIVATGFPAD